MVVKEYYGERFDGVKLFKNFSTDDKYLIQVETGIVYDVAIDVEDAPFTYIESDKYIGEEEEDDRL